MEKITSTGKCLFCGKEFPQSGITRHLNTHLSEKIKNGKGGKSFHLRVELKAPRGYATPYFLNLWIDGNTTLYKLDNFLREIWLECCGHMSSFNYSGTRKK